MTSSTRRVFLTALGGVRAWPRLGTVQPAERTYRVGWLSTAALRTEPYNLAFGQRLRELGFVEGRTSGNFVPARRRIPELALKHRLPSMFGNAVWADAGGLMSYGPNFSDFYRVSDRWPGA